MMIQRENYLRLVQSVLGKNVIKVFLGMRRTGKSTLLLQIQEELMRQGIDANHIISINFEWLEYSKLKNHMELNEYIESKFKDNSKYYVFLDEIQEVEGFEKVVNSIHSKGRAEVFITGSNSKLLSGELATLLTGRFFTIEVLPFSFSEIFDPQKPDEEQLIEYIASGGLPGRFMFESIRTAKGYITDMYQSILLRDIVKRNDIRDVELLQRFMLYMMNHISRIFSAVTITNYLKSEGRRLSKETIYNYIEAAKAAYLIHGVPRYNIRGKELMKTNEKYFINDLGIRGLYFDNEKDIGQSLENIVYLELRRRGYVIYTGKTENQEIDFVVFDGAKTAYIQVAYLLAEPTTIEREFSALESIEDNYPKYVISMDKVNRSRNGIVHKNIMDFLMESDDVH